MEREKLQVARSQSYPQDASRSPKIEKYTYEKAFSTPGPAPDEKISCSQFKDLVGSNEQSQSDMKTSSGSPDPDEIINISDETASSQLYKESSNENGFQEEESTSIVKSQGERTDQISRVDRIPHQAEDSQQSAIMSRPSRKGHETIEMVTRGCERSPSNESQFQTPATDICKCEKWFTCSRFCKFISEICKAKRSDRQEISKKLTDFLTKEQVSLAAKFCPYSGTKPKTVLMTVLEEVPNGCDIIKDQLNNLKEFDEENEVINIKLGTGKLFEGKENQAKILKDLLSVRNRTKKGPRHEALTRLIKHPVIVIFILEKWKVAKCLFIIHLRYLKKIIAVI